MIISPTVVDCIDYGTRECQYFHQVTVTGLSQRAGYIIIMIIVSVNYETRACQLIQISVIVIVIVIFIVIVIAFIAFIALIVIVTVILIISTSVVVWIVSNLWHATVNTFTTGSHQAYLSALLISSS